MVGLHVDSHRVTITGIWRGFCADSSELKKAVGKEKKTYRFGMSPAATIGCFFPRLFFLAGGTVLLGSFQACAIYIPAAMDVQGDKAQSKPLLIRGGRGLGWWWVGGGPLGEHIAGEGLVSNCDGASDANLSTQPQTIRFYWIEAFPFPNA